MKEKTRKTVAIGLFGIGMFIPLFNIWAAWLLRKSCSPVMRLFFKRFWVATVIMSFAGVLLVGSLAYIWKTWINIFSDVPALIGVMSFAIIVCVFIVAFLMNGSELITRYYQLDDVTASRVRLFQMGVLSFPLNIFPPYGSCITNLLMFLGLLGIIRSDLLAEERSGEDCGVVKVNRWSRPVIAALCFYGCLLVLGGIILGFGGYHYL